MFGIPVELPVGKLCFSTLYIPVA